MKPMLTGALAAAFLAALLATASAQEAKPGMGMGENMPMHQGMSMDHDAMPMDPDDMPMNQAGSGGDSASTEAFRAADRAMMQDMMIDYSGNADIDFVRGMIPHHQGAIDMAEVELKFGTDPKIRALAEAIIKAQTDEIAFMNAWLAEHAQ